MGRQATVKRSPFALPTADDYAWRLCRQGRHDRPSGARVSQLAPFQNEGWTDYSAAAPAIRPAYAARIGPASVQGFGHCPIAHMMIAPDR
jgi:hypothetical protein